MSEDQVGFETLKMLGEADAFNRWMYEAIAPDISGEVLEIGSGVGNISEHICSGGFDLTLTEMNPSYLQLLNKKFGGRSNIRQVIKMDLEDPEFEKRFSAFEGKFTTVIALNVIEHIKDHEKAIERCVRLLSTNGTLIILVPAHQPLFNTFDRELGHFRRYEKAEVTMMFQPHFNIISTRHFNMAGIPGWWLFGSVFRRKLIPPTSLKIFNSLVPFFKLTDHLLKNRTGLSLIAVGKQKIRAME